MESSPSSRLTFFDITGDILQRPVEGRACGIAIDLPKERWPYITLKLGTDVLPLRLDETALFAYSDLPALGPGNHELSLSCGVIREQRMITVRPEHFNETEFNSIIHDLTNVLPGSIASRVQECGGLAGANLARVSEPTPEQEFHNLQAAIGGTKKKLGILQLLPLIQRECHQVLLSRSEIHEANKVRRPDISKLPHAVCMPGNVSSRGTLARMYDVTVHSSFETYENRLVKAYVQGLQSRLSRLQARLGSEVAPPAMALQLESLASEFRLARMRATFLLHVKRPFVSAGRVTMVLLKHPAYRAVLEDYLALYRQASVRFEASALDNPLNQFPILYQLWANLNVVSATLQVCAESGYKCVSHAWIKQDDRGFYFQPMNDGVAAIELSCPTTGTKVSILPWRTDSERDGTMSIVEELPPALAIAVGAPGKIPVALLFDSKYRVTVPIAAKAVEKRARSKKAFSKPVSGKNKTLKLQAVKIEIPEALSVIEPMQEDIDELRACIAQVKTPGGAREIHYAAILYPGQRRQLAHDLEALPARPSEAPALQKYIGDVLRRYLT